MRNVTTLCQQPETSCTCTQAATRPAYSRQAAPIISLEAAHAHAVGQISRFRILHLQMLPPTPVGSRLPHPVSFSPKQIPKRCGGLTRLQRSSMHHQEAANAYNACNRGYCCMPVKPAQLMCPSSSLVPINLPSLFEPSLREKHRRRHLMAAAWISLQTQTAHANYELRLAELPRRTCTPELVQQPC